jgi:hypothetical protein
MRVSRVIVSKAAAAKTILTVALVCLASFAPAQQAQQSDQVAADRILGPRWEQLFRRAGIIFAGTVLASPTQTPASQTALTDRPVPGTNPSVRPIELSFRIDHAIAGVEPGQILTIHEWAGASSMHPPMFKGQHILLFLYPPSRLGLTSPVGGSQGQIALDPSGEYVAIPKSAPAAGVQSEFFARSSAITDARSVSVLQLERAIRSARTAKARIGEE